MIISSSPNFFSSKKLENGPKTSKTAKNSKNIKKYKKRIVVVYFSKGSTQKEN